MKHKIGLKFLGIICNQIRSNSRKTPSQIQVTVGQLSLTLPDPGELRLQIRAIIVHENYNSITKFNDIAMLEVGCF